MIPGPINHLHRNQNLCGSEAAREGGGTFNIVIA
jgi:hypothetical protein